MRQVEWLQWLFLPVTLGKSAAPISLVIPCNVEDFKHLPLVLSSIANQTVLPQETILIANLPNSHANGALFLDTLARSSSEENHLSQSLWNKDEDHDIDLYDSLTHLSSTWPSLPSKMRRSKYTVENVTTPPEDYEFSLLGQAMEGPSLDGAGKNLTQQLQKIIYSLPPVKDSITALPRFKIYVRAGLHYAANNRVYGASMATNEIISFFDADDYLHPQRIEHIWKVFETNPDLEALTHAYKQVKLSDWDTEMAKFLQPINTSSFVLVHPYKTFWDKLPVHKLAKDQSEPKYNPSGGPVKGQYHWYFPKDIGLSSPPLIYAAHNGWLTIKKQVLAEVPYPDLPRGQDSLFNWRIIRHHRNWNFFGEALGAYVIFK